LTGTDFRRNKLYLKVIFFIQKKLQISLPEQNKGLYVCSRLERGLKGVGDKGKVH